MTDQNTIAIILTAIIAMLATIAGASIVRKVLDPLAPTYEERQARYHDRQASKHLAGIPTATRDDRPLLAELANEHQKIADKWRSQWINGQHGPEQNFEKNTSNNAEK